MKRFNGKCGGCGSKVSVLAESKGNVRHPVAGWVRGYVTPAGIELRSTSSDFGALVVECGCARKIVLRSVRGVMRPEIKCDARCEGATGHSCECSCGGKNHGASHG